MLMSLGGESRGAAPNPAAAAAAAAAQRRNFHHHPARFGSFASYGQYPMTPSVAANYWQRMQYMPRYGGGNFLTDDDDYTRASLKPRRQSEQSARDFVCLTRRCERAPLSVSAYPCQNCGDNQQQFYPSFNADNSINSVTGGGGGGSGGGGGKIESFRRRRFERSCKSFAA